MARVLQRRLAGGDGGGSGGAGASRAKPRIPQQCRASCSLWPPARPFCAACPSWPLVGLQGCALLGDCDSVAMDSCLDNVTTTDICAATDAKVKCLEDTGCCNFKRGGVGQTMSGSNEVISSEANDMIFDGTCTFSWATVNHAESSATFTHCNR